MTICEDALDIYAKLEKRVKGGFWSKPLVKHRWFFAGTNSYIILNRLCKSDNAGQPSTEFDDIWTPQDKRSALALLELEKGPEQEDALQNHLEYLLGQLLVSAKQGNERATEAYLKWILNIVITLKDKKSVELIKGIIDHERPRLQAQVGRTEGTSDWKPPSAGEIEREELAEGLYRYKYPLDLFSPSIPGKELLITQDGIDLLGDPRSETFMETVRDFLNDAWYRGGKRKYTLAEQQVFAKTAFGRHFTSMWDPRKLETEFITTYTLHLLLKRRSPEKYVFFPHKLYFATRGVLVSEYFTHRRPSDSRFDDKMRAAQMAFIFDCMSLAGKHSLKTDTNPWNFPCRGKWGDKYVFTVIDQPEIL